MVTDWEATVRGSVVIRSIVLLSWCLALLAGTALFHALGSGLLAAPPADPSAWGAWLAERDPLIATAALLRLAAVATSWYLIGVTAVGSLARLLRAARLLRFADALTLPAVRRLLQRSLGVAMAAAMATSVPAAGDAPPGSPPMVLAAVGAEDERGPQGSASTPDPGTAPPSVTLRGLPVPTLGDPASPATPAAGPGAPATEVPLPWQLGVGSAAEDAGTAAATHVVTSGESLWRIASAHLQASLARSPLDAEVVPYWRELIEANRDRLPDRDDPDLILPGQELLVPPVAP